MKYQKSKQNYCYALVDRKTGRLILVDHKLPIYWNRKVALSDAIIFQANYIKINMEELENLLR